MIEKAGTREPFLEALSRPRPDPGGGAAAAYAGSVAVALLEKVCRLELGRGGPAEGQWSTVLERVQGLKNSLEELRERDSLAYLAWARVRASGAGANELNSVVEEATIVPIRIMEASADLLKCVSAVGSRCALHLVPDVLVCCELAGAALRGALHIATANLRFFPDPSSSDTYRNQLALRIEVGLGLLVNVRKELTRRLMSHVE